MRGIGGTARGRKLKEPKDRRIRPTTDKVKESMFDIIQFETEGRRVLDMFAGTGQLGIEALSRGAAEAVFTETSGEAVALIRENLRTAGLEERARIVKGDSLTSVRTLGRFGLIFLDPPYSRGLLEKALDTIFEFDILCDDGIIICEYPSEDTLPVPEPPYRLRREYLYGKIRLAVLVREDQP